jgi:hypothetical protein
VTHEEAHAVVLISETLVIQCYDCVKEVRWIIFFSGDLEYDHPDSVTDRTGRIFWYLASRVAR